MPTPTHPLPPAQTAIVTGASRGIGREIAIGLANAGIAVALVATNKEKLDAVAKEITDKGGKCVVVPGDVSSIDDVEAAVKGAKEALGHIDMLVNAAGVIDPEVTAWEADPEQWWRAFEINVRGPFLLARALVPAMLAAGGGRIVDLSSGAASHPMGEASGYNASKTALLRLGEHMALAGGDQGLKVFEVAPGVVQTDMTNSMNMHEGRTDWTPVQLTVDMVLAIAKGEIDDCSGWFIRVTEDTPESLKTLSQQAGVRIARRLRVLPAHPGDPLADLLTGR